MKRRSRIAVPPHAAGTRLVDFLSGRFSYLGKDRWVKETEQARVLVNGRTAAADVLLRVGDMLEYLPADAEEPPVDNAYDILFEDDAVIAVNKPGNLPCHPGGRYFHHTLWALIRRRNPADDLFFVHRLDRETSGVVLMAKHARDASALGRQMALGNFRKRYTALVEGRFPESPVSAEGVLAPDRRSAIRKKIRFYPPASPEAQAEGKHCRTLFRLILKGPGLSLVSAAPATGRRHQIRATLLALGYPVVGDKLYGVDETLFIRFIEGRLTDHDRTCLRIDRQALHSAELAFHHPRTDRRLRIIAPIPPMFERLANETP